MENPRRNMALIRRANVNDARALARIKYFSWLDAYKDIFSTEVLKSNMNLRDLTKHFSEAISSCDENNAFYVCEVKGKVVGYILTLCKSSDERDMENSYIGSMLNYLNIGDFELSDLYILPSQQRKGYGQLLFDFAKSKCKSLNITKMFWHCYSDNKKGVKFYLKNKAKIVDNSDGEVFNIKASGCTMEIEI